jgi:hypothetical protein
MGMFTGSSQSGHLARLRATPPLRDKKTFSISLPTLTQVVFGERSTTERSVSNSDSPVLIEMIGFDGPLLVRLEARTREVLSLAAQPKPLLLKSLEARVGFEPTYRGFADLEELTNNPFIFRLVVF